MTPEAEALVHMRLDQAEHNLKEAEILIAAQQRYAVTRLLYFSMFYSACALLASKQLDSSKHSDVISLLHNGFVKTGLFPPEIARLLNQAFELRHEADYRPIEPPTLERLKALVEDARSFLTATKLFLGKQ